VSPRVARGELLVFGIGPQGPGQLTWESVELLKTCDEVRAAAFAEELKPFCAALDIPLKALHWGEKKATPHESVAPGRNGGIDIQKSLLSSLRRGRRVGLIVDGHPALFSFATPLVTAALDEGFRCRTFAAISSLDQILAILPPSSSAVPDIGFHVCNALSRAAASFPFRVDGLFYLFNVGSLFKTRRRDFEALLETLVSVYGNRGKCLLVECVPGGENVRRGTIGGLARQLPLIGVNATVVVLPQL
jgi:precorrin-6B methylase 1